MNVIDLNGCVITIENLDKAIEQAAEFKEYHHIDDPTKADFDARQRHYWRYLHRKLVRIRNEQCKAINTECQ